MPKAILHYQYLHDTLIDIREKEKNIFYLELRI